MSKNKIFKCNKCQLTKMWREPRVSYDGILEQPFFEKEGQIYCFDCLVKSGIKCGECQKNINLAEKKYSWSGITGIWHNDELIGVGKIGFSCNDCRNLVEQQSPECQPKKVATDKPKKVCRQHYTQLAGNPGCDNLIPGDRDYCDYHDPVRKLAEDEKGKKIGGQYEIARQKAQNYWNTLTREEKEKELERVVEGIKQGKYWGTDRRAKNIEDSGSGNASNETWWWIKNGKMTSNKPHLVPIEIVEEFAKKEFGDKFYSFLDGDMRSRPVVSNTSSQPSAKNNFVTASDSNLFSFPTQSSTIDKKNDDNATFELRLNLEKKPSEKEQVNSVVPTLAEKNDSKKNDSEIRASEEKTKANNQFDSKILLNYFQKNNINKVSLVENQLVIEYHSPVKNSSQVVFPQTIVNLDQDQELQNIVNYCQKTGKNSLSREELNNLTENDQSSVAKPTSNNSFWPLVLGGVLALGVVIVYFSKKKRQKK